MVNLVPVQNPSYTYITPGNYLVTLYASNEFGYTSSSQTIILSSQPQPGLMIQPTNTSNWTYNFSTAGYVLDLPNSTYMKDWMYYLVVTNNTDQGPWDFPVIGFAYDIMGPFTNAFAGTGITSGNIVYLILFGLFVLMVWRQSGKTTIPAMICCIVGGAWAMLFPALSDPMGYDITVCSNCKSATYILCKRIN